MNMPFLSNGKHLSVLDDDLLTCVLTNFPLSFDSNIGINCSMQKLASEEQHSTCCQFEDLLNDHCKWEQCHLCAVCVVGDHASMHHSVTSGESLMSDKTHFVPTEPGCVPSELSDAKICLLFHHTKKHDIGLSKFDLQFHNFFSSAIFYSLTTLHGDMAQLTTCHWQQSHCQCKCCQCCFAKLCGQLLLFGCRFTFAGRWSEPVVCLSHPLLLEDLDY